jgi:hypothetical protein
MRQSVRSVRMGGRIVPAVVALNEVKVAPLVGSARAV